MKLIEGARQAQSATERSMVAASLPTGLWLDFFKAKAAEQAPGWMQTFVDAGSLRSEQFYANAANADEWLNGLERWAKSAHVFLDFMGVPVMQSGAVYLVDEMTPLPENMPEPWLRFTPSQEARAIFTEQSEGFALQMQAVLAHPWYERKLKVLTCSPRDTGILLALSSRWLAIACMADMPEVARTVLHAHPHAMRCAVPASTMGQAFCTQLLQDDVSAAALAHFEVSPFLCAMSLSSMRCLDVLIEAGAGADPDTVCERHFHTRAPRFMQLSSLCDHFTPLCEEGAYAHALQHLLARANLEVVDAAQRNGLRWLQERNARYRCAVPALVASGLFDSIAGSAIQSALYGGHEVVLERMAAHFPWDALLSEKNIEWSSPVMRVLSNINDAKDTLRENTIMRLLAIAEKDGVADQLFHTFVRDRGLTAVIEPLSTLIDHGFTRALVAYIEHGLDPRSSQATFNSTDASQVLSPCDYADENNPAMATLLRSAYARKMANDVLGSFDAFVSRSAP